MSVALLPSGVGQDVPTPPDDRPIHRLITGTRRLLRFTHVLTGLGLTIGVLVALMTGVVLLDLLFPGSPESWLLRLVGLVAITAPSVVVLVARVLAPLVKPMPAGEIARQIEKQIPHIHNRLVSSLDPTLRHRVSASSVFYQRLVKEAVERIRDFRPASVVDGVRLRRMGLFAGISLVGFGLAWLFLGVCWSTALARIIAPFDDIPPASGVVYTVETGDAKVPRGDDIPFTVRVEHGQPSSLQLEIRGSRADQKLSYPLEPSRDDPRLWTFTLGSANIGPGFEDGFRYRILGGGTWSRPYDVALLDRPAITDLSATLHYPDYLKKRTQLFSSLGCVGGRIEVAVSVQDPRQVVAAEVVLGCPLWINGKVPEGSVVEGPWQWNGNVEGRTAHTEPPAVAIHAHWFRDDPVGFAVQAGETLFADVFLPAQHKPSALMLQWHDGTSWEHRAVWGEDHFRDGQPGTPSRLHMGPLPETGRWVQLQMSVDDLGLAGQRLRGLAFVLDGGQAYWGQVGVVPAKVRLPMKRHGDDWVGSILLDRSGSFRVELRNELGQTNLPMQPQPFVARPDEAPQVLLKRPGPELVRNEPGLVLLEIEAVDDFALDELAVLTRLGDKSDPVRQVIETYQPSESTEPEKRQVDFVQYDLDLTALGMKVGDVLRYRLEARDRKGQTAHTTEFVIRLQPGPNSAEQQLAAFDKGQELFQLKLDQLVKAQAEVRDKVEQLAKKSDAAPLRQEMSRLSRQEQMNAKAAELLRQDMAWSAEQLSQLPNLPGQLAEQMRAAQRLFEQMTIPGLKDLADQMTQAADPRQSPPQMPAMQKQSDRLQKELEAIQDRVNAIAAARKKAASDRDQALADLMKEIQKQNAGLAKRELEELRDHLSGLQDELKRHEDNQQQVEKETTKAADKELNQVEKKQTDLEKEVEKTLAQARELRDGDKTRRMTKPMSSGEEEQEATGDQTSRDHLRDRQQKTMKDVQQAKQGLSSDEKSLEQMLQKLQKPEGPPDLQKMLQSEALKQALAMAQRMKDLRGRAQASRQQTSGQRNPTPSPSNSGNMQGTAPNPDMEAKLANLDPAMRGLLLKMPPRLREDLLQGLEEKGPDGYQKFIEDYFRRLTEIPGGTRGGR